MLITPAQPVRAGQLVPGSPSELPCRKQPREELSAACAMLSHFKHGWSLLLAARTCNHRLVLFADSDISHVDLDSVNVGALFQLVEVLFHQGPVEATFTIVEVGQAPTMDNLVSAPQWATLLTSLEPPLGSTFSALLIAYTTSAAPLLVPGPSFPPEFKHQSAVLLGVPIVFSGAPCRAPGRHNTAYGRSAVAQSGHLLC